MLPVRTELGTSAILVHDISVFHDKRSGRFRIVSLCLCRYLASNNICFFQRKSFILVGLYLSYQQNFKKLQFIFARYDSIFQIAYREKLDCLAWRLVCQGREVSKGYLRIITVKPDGKQDELGMACAKGSVFE